MSGKKSVTLWLGVRHADQKANEGNFSILSYFLLSRSHGLSFELVLCDAALVGSTVGEEFLNTEWDQWKPIILKNWVATHLLR